MRKSRTGHPVNHPVESICYTARAPNDSGNAAASRPGTDPATSTFIVHRPPAGRHLVKQRNGLRPRDRRVVVQEAVSRGRVPDTVRPGGFDEAGAHGRSSEAGVHIERLRRGLSREEGPAACDSLAFLGESVSIVHPAETLQAGATLDAG